MLVLSFATLLEEASTDFKALSGNIADLDVLLEPENLAQVEKIAKMFAFLAYHSDVDTAIADYVTLPDDSGPDLLVLFTLDSPAPTPVAIARQQSEQPPRSRFRWGHCRWGTEVNATPPEHGTECFTDATKTTPRLGTTATC